MEWHGNQVVHIMCSTSNGFAQISVKNMKNALKKIGTNSIDSASFMEFLMEYRNTPRSEGRSPNQVVFGRNLRTLLPSHSKSLNGTDNVEAEDGRRKKETLAQKTKENYDRQNKLLQGLQGRDKVIVQDPTTKKWSHRGVIIQVGRRRSYQIKLESGRQTWRN